MFVYFLVRMRKCTRVSLKRPCSYRIRWGFLHFPAVFPHRNFLLLILTKEKRNETCLFFRMALLLLLLWLYARITRELNAAIWSTARRAGSPRTFIFVFFLRRLYSSKGENPILFFGRAKLKKLCRINIIVMALLTSPPRAIIRRHGCTTFVPPARTHQHQTRPHHHSQQVGR